MANVTVQKDRYTVDPVYQWDKDQSLVITGLSLASIPEIHFTNDAMDKAIVRQSTMDDAGVITAEIPNSLLQKPYKIRAYVCIYEGETFKSLYLITIPVKARSMPTDYTLTVSDDEVYSFNALENLIINTVASNEKLSADVENSNALLENELKATYEAKLEEFKAISEETVQECENITSETTAQLSARVDNLVANASNTEENSELIDIRVGVDGTVYDNAGTAVRKQFIQLSSEIDDAVDVLKNSSQSVIIKDFVKKNNLVNMIDVLAVNATDGLTRSFSKNIADPARSTLNGTFHAINVAMKISDYMTLEEGKTYSVYACEESQRANMALYLYSADGKVYQENGVNKAIAKTITEPFCTITPETSGNYYIGVYLNFEETFVDNSLYIYVIEGEYTLDDFMYLYAKEEMDRILEGTENRINVPKEIVDKNLSDMKTNVVIKDYKIVRTAKKGDKNLSILNGDFPANTYTVLSETFTLEQDKTYTVYAVSEFDVNVRILFLKENNSFLANGAVNVNAYPNGLTYIKPNVSGNVKACLYSYIDQTFNDQPISLYIVEGEYSVPDFHKYVTSADAKNIVENLSDVANYKDKILSKNLLIMTTNYLTGGVAAPSVIDRSITKLNGKINSLRLSNEFNLLAGTTYTVCVIDTVKDVNYSIFFEDVSTGTPLQVNGANKGFNVTNNTFFDVFTPDVSATVRAYIYNKNNDQVTDRYLRILVIEGRYTYNELLSDKDSSVVGFNHADYNLPVLNLFGSTTGMSKDNEATLDYKYGEHEGACSVKWQGSSSIMYPKKNYTIKFDSKFEAVDGWGEQKKYCLKANYIDFSHARNVVSAKLWGQIVKSRSVQNDNLYNLPNGGAIDGFPVMLVINGVYQGIYTFNIPKDKWMFDMGDGDAEYMITAEQHDMRTAFKQAITLEELQSEQYFAIEYAPDTVEEQTVVDSLNNLINACINAGENYRETVGQYMDMDSAIDYFIFTCLLCGGDITNKNYILVTYDGIKWLLSAYDLDAVFGNYWDGKSYNEASHTPMFINYSNMNRLMKLIYTYDKEALKARYAELRKTVMSEENVMYMFYNFVAGIPKALYDEEVKIWTNIPGTQTNNLAQIMDFYRLRVKALDAEIEAL